MIPSHTAPATRPAPTKKALTDLTISIPGSQARPDAPVQPSRWGTTEFKLYGLVFALVVPLMVLVPMRLSSGERTTLLAGHHRF